MSKAFKCDMCQEVFEGSASQRSPEFPWGDDSIKVVFIVEVHIEGVSNPEICNECNHQMLTMIPEGVQPWPQTGVGQVGGVDVVDSASLLRGTSGRNRMSLVENEQGSGISLEGLDE